MSKVRATLAAMTAVGTVLASTPVLAAGCNGVVDVFRWGCAPWDNNNGPRYPYYKTKRFVIPKSHAKIEVHQGVQMVRDTRTNQLHPKVGETGAGVISAGSLN